MAATLLVGESLVGEGNEVAHVDVLSTDVALCVAPLFHVTGLGQVSMPTGTEIGAPVSITSCPRVRPSDVSIAMVRTVDSPRCCATSSTRRLP